MAVSYERRKGAQFETVESDYVVVGVPSHRVSRIFDGLREPHRALFEAMSERGAYYLVNYQLPMVPIDPHVFSIIPHTRWTTDIVLTNAAEDAYLPVGSEVESVVTAYVPFTPTEKNRAKQSGSRVLQEVRDEVVSVRPELAKWLDRAMEKGLTRMTYWNESMSCPRPGQLTELAEAGLTLGPRVFYAHSDAQHPSAPGAIEGGLEVLELIEAARKADARRRRTVISMIPPRSPARNSPKNSEDEPPVPERRVG